MFRPELLKAKMVELNIDAAYLSDKLGINITTFYRKINGNSEFDRSEMQIIRSELRLSKEEMDSIFFA